MTVTIADDKDKYLSYPIPNDELIKQLKLIRHIEGGYFVETDRQEKEVPSPFADGASRSLATSIYYLLSYEEPEGVFLMNKSATMHVLHQGRAEYTLIHPGVDGKPPTVETKIMGPNIHAGETMQLLVGSNVWKKSRLLPEDMTAAKTDPSKRPYTGCLITEVVFPGFYWEDHQFLSMSKLQELFGEDDVEKKKWEQYVRKIEIPN